jgi:hypothetical protein
MSLNIPQISKDNNYCCQHYINVPVCLSVRPSLFLHVRTDWLYQQNIPALYSVLPLSTALSSGVCVCVCVRYLACPVCCWGRSSSVGKVTRLRTGRYGVRRRLDPPSPVSIMAPKRRNATAWFLANVALFRTQQRWHLTLHGFMDFLKWSRWKVLCSKRAKESVGNYLIIME